MTVTLATVLMLFLCSMGTIVEVSTIDSGTRQVMSTLSLGRPSKKPTALSEVAVARVTAAVHGAMVCFVLAVLVGHLAGVTSG